MSQTLIRAWWRARRAVGVPGLVAAALFIPAVALLAWLPHYQQESEAASVTYAQQSKAALRRLQNMPRPVSNADITHEFVAGFPHLTQNADDLQAVFETAKRHGVALVKGEYQLKTDPNSAFVTYIATFPVRNEFGTLKDFTADVLTALPHVAMDELRMTRENAGATSLESVVRFTFYYRVL